MTGKPLRRAVLAAFGWALGCYAQAAEPSMCLSICDADLRTCQKDAQYQPGSLGGIATLALGAGLAYATNRNPADSWKLPGYALQQGGGGTAAGADQQARDELMHDCQVTRRQCADACARQDDAESTTPESRP